ncbi:type 1 fimbrial protein [Enterobacteriaceae bacterium H18W14]|uniref:fimbrial protein n=1 Tax=Dryocola boscaweniae TaxID=2925397 RepID=UPI0022F0E738|nr:fimbrial protein [Dryocola boscaweniae]MCT4715768.1 type 1 fimbrial protein [Dryocola boscaweniae]
MSLINAIMPGIKYFRAALLTAMVGGQVLSTASACVTDCSIEVNFTGNYTDETCNVIIDNAGNDAVISLPQRATRLLKQNGSETGSTPFDITLKDCPASRTVSVFFNSSFSSADTATGNLLNTTGANFAQHVQIRLRKENNSQVIIDDAITGQDYIISSAADPLTHRFTASYYANGDSTVTAGKVHAAAGVELVYK